MIFVSSSAKWSGLEDMVIIASDQRPGAALMIREFVYRNVQLPRPSECAPAIDTSRKSRAHTSLQERIHFPVDQRVRLFSIPGFQDLRRPVRSGRIAYPSRPIEKDRGGSMGTSEPLQ